MTRAFHLFTFRRPASPRGPAKLAASIEDYIDSAAAQSADRYRGGWRTDDSDPHTYEFSIRGERVRGIYCTMCSDATTLAFIDGTLGSDGITFVVTVPDVGRVRPATIRSLRTSVS